MDKYNRIQLAVLVIGVLLIVIGGYFSYTAQTVDARKQYALIIILGSMVSFSAGFLGLFFMKLRDKNTTKETAKLLSQFSDQLTKTDSEKSINKQN